MKVIHLSDTHLVAPGEYLYGSDPLFRLEMLLAHASQQHPDADALIISGDLAHRGQLEAYQALAALISRQILPVHLMLGNHDRRATFHAAQLTQTGASNDFVQQALNVHGHHLLLLDTLDEGQAGGRLCERRLAWLAEALERCNGQPVYIFCHHPPFEVGMAPLDHCRLSDDEYLHALLRTHGNIRHLFCGHVHRNICGSWRGLPYSTVKGSNHQTKLQLGDRPHARSNDVPGYAVILANADTVTVHYQDVPG